MAFLFPLQNVAIKKPMVNFAFFLGLKVRLHMEVIVLGIFQTINLAKFAKN